MIRIILLFIFIPSIASSQTEIKIHFLYGSKPAKGFKQSESKLFGGIKGGHVNIELNGQFLDFMPGDCPLLPERKNPSGGFHINNSVYWDPDSDKWATVTVPVTNEQVKSLKDLFDAYAKKSPYDYAVFGMRCAAASYDVLSEIGLMKKISNSNNVIKHFYPKLLRKKIFKWAEKNNYAITYHDGKSTRKWEKDSGPF